MISEKEAEKIKERLAQEEAEAMEMEDEENKNENTNNEKEVSWISPSQIILLKFRTFCFLKPSVAEGYKVLNILETNKETIYIWKRSLKKRRWQRRKRQLRKLGP